MRHQAHKKLFVLSIAVYAVVVSQFALGVETGDEVEDDTAEFVSSALAPFWSADRLREPLFFIQADPKKMPSASLLFVPKKILSVTSATRDILYESGRDFLFEPSANSLVIPPKSRIPFKTLNQLYPLMTSDLPKIGRLQGNKLRGVFFDNQSGYHNAQIEVTYECKPGQWNGCIPNYAGELLPRTISKLQSGKALRLALFGDSISAGYNSSKFTTSSPGCPPYGELVALALARHYDSRVHFENYAVSGWASNDGLLHVMNSNFGIQLPDLVMIAFGMNDVVHQDSKRFQENIRRIISVVREHSPSTEFLLVSSMLGNSEWGLPMEQFAIHRDALRELTGEGIALADLTCIWEELLKHKSFYDLTGNGVNHPNDFGHCIYAQTILKSLIDTQINR